MQVTICARLRSFAGCTLFLICPLVAPKPVFAGGFAVREQSASLLGSAFAGAAAGGDLSSAFWNPAAFGIAGNGLTTISAYSAIFADTELSNGVTSPGALGGATSTDIDKAGALSASYGAYRLNERTVLGVSMTSPFGLATDPDDQFWVGRVHGRAAEMLSFNVSPTLAYEVSPGVHVAAGLQLQHMKLKLWSAVGALDPFAASAKIKVDDDVGVGFTAGLLLKPTEGTSIGIGYRSKIQHDLEGTFSAPGVSAPVSADLETPEIVTLSLTQSITQKVRLLGTLEWTNWSRIDRVPIDGFPGAVVDARWDDGWFVSSGLDYDYSEVLTLRGGIAFERSPIQDATQRLVPLPDSDRVWLSLGVTYRYSESTTIDAGYSHVFFEDAYLTRGTLTNPAFLLNADVDNSADIISVGVRTQW